MSVSDERTEEPGEKMRRASQVQMMTVSNARERARIRVLRGALCRLRGALPFVPADTKLTQLDTLRLATRYIAHLSQILAGDKRRNHFIHPENLAPEGPRFPLCRCETKGTEPIVVDTPHPRASGASSRAEAAGNDDEEDDRLEDRLLVKSRLACSETTANHRDKPLPLPAALRKLPPPPPPLASQASTPQRSRPLPSALAEQPAHAVNHAAPSVLSSTPQSDGASGDGGKHHVTTSAAYWPSARPVPASAVSSGEKPNKYTSPNSLQASGASWITAGSSVPPPVAQASSHNETSEVGDFVDPNMNESFCNVHAHAEEENYFRPLWKMF